MIVRKTPRLLLLCLILLASAVSCRKYEDGPAFSLRTKKERLSNQWKVAWYAENGTDKTDAYNAFFTNAKMHISNTGGFIFTYKENGIIERDAGGDWYFSDDKTEVTFFQTAPAQVSWTWKILRLKERDLRVQETDSGGMVKEFHFIPY